MQNPRMVKTKTQKDLPCPSKFKHNCKTQSNFQHPSSTLTWAWLQLKFPKFEHDTRSEPSVTLTYRTPLSSFTWNSPTNHLPPCQTSPESNPSSPHHPLVLCFSETKTLKLFGIWRYKTCWIDSNTVIATFFSFLSLLISLLSLFSHACL